MTRRLLNITDWALGALLIVGGMVAVFAILADGMGYGR